MINSRVTHFLLALVGKKKKKNSVSITPYLEEFLFFLHLHNKTKLVPFENVPADSVMMSRAESKLEEMQT